MLHTLPKSHSGQKAQDTSQAPVFQSWQQMENASEYVLSGMSQAGLFLAPLVTEPNQQSVTGPGGEEKH